MSERDIAGMPMALISKTFGSAIRWPLTELMLQYWKQGRVYVEQGSLNFTLVLTEKKWSTCLKIILL